jgi:ATP-binding cassette, subfamily B (MDR/TAP), member 10
MFKKLIKYKQDKKILFVSSIRKKFEKKELKIETKEKKLNEKLPNLKRILELTKPEKKFITYSIISIGISTAISLSIPMGIGQMIDSITTITESELALQNIKKISTVLGALFGVGFISSFARISLMQISCQRIATNLRTNLFKKILKQEISFFDKNKSGEIINRLSTDGKF